MKNLMKLWMACASVALSSGVTHAQTSVTNVALATTFTLTGFQQSDTSSATPLRITNKDILALLNESGQFDFGTDAQILLVSTDDEESAIWVREGSGTNVTTTDVTGFLSVVQRGAVTKNDAIRYANRVFVLDNHNGTSFDVCGSITLHRGNVRSKSVGKLLRVRTVTGQVQGGGTLENANVVLHGTITAGSPNAEVDEQ